MFEMKHHNAMTQAGKRTYWEILSGDIKYLRVPEGVIATDRDGDSYNLTFSSQEVLKNIMLRDLITIDTETKYFKVNNSIKIKQKLLKQTNNRVFKPQELLDFIGEKDIFYKNKSNGSYDLNHLHYLGFSYIDTLASHDTTKDTTYFQCIMLYGRPIAIAEVRKPYKKKGNSMIVTVTVHPFFRGLGLSKKLISDTRKIIKEDIVYHTKESIDGKNSHIGETIKKEYGKKYKGYEDSY